MTTYSEEMAMLETKENGSYTFGKSVPSLEENVMSGKCQSIDSQVTVNCQSTDSQMSAQVRLGKDSIGKGSISNDLLPEAETAPDYASPVVISIILNDKTEFPITEDDVAGWKKLYPAVDVMQELRKMKGWADSNPKKRKTKSGIKRFINRWLAKEQDNYHGPRGGAQYGSSGNIGNGPAIGKEF